MVIEEMKNKAYQMAKNEEYEEQDDLMENFLLMQLYSIYRLFNSGLMQKQKAIAATERAIRDYKVFKLHQEMYLGR